MWFIRDLICVVIISPLLAWLLKKTRGYILLAFVALYLLKIQTPVPDMFQTTCLFFSLGAWFSLRKKDFAVTLAPYAFFLLVLWVPLLVYNVYWDGARTYEGLLLYPLMVVVGVFAVIALLARQLGSKGERRPSCARSFIDYAARNTFFIYAAHGLFALPIVSPLVNKITAVVLSLSLFQHPIASTIISMAAYLLIPFLAVALCLAVLYPLQRYTPRLAKVLTGAR